MINREIACTTCIHKEVCSNQTQFLAAQRVIDNLSVGTQTHGAFRDLKDIHWIEPVVLKCKHYVARKVPLTRREVN